jgi:exopolysaccharide biosynthesis polyprenyl glycosylphosphotransferase
MSSPAVSEPDGYVHRVPPASRLIPGLAFGAAPRTRKKPQWVQWDQRDREGEEQPESISAPTATTAGTSLWHAIAPTPESRNRHHLLSRVAADFLLTTICLEVITAALHRWGMIEWPTSHLGLNLVYGALLTLFGYSEGLYRGDTPRAMEAVILGKVLAWTTVLSTAILYHHGGAPVHAAVASAPFLYFGLVGWRTWKRRCDTNSASRRNVLIIGAGERGRQLAVRLSEDNLCGVCGFLDDHEPVTGDVLGRTADLVRVARAEFADEVILAGVPVDTARRIIREAHKNRLDVSLVPESIGLESPLAIEHCGDATLLTIHEEAIPSISLLVKRTADLLISACAMGLTLPLLAAIALLIKLDSTGPVFYRAPRIGKKGRQFLCYKFRTMIAAADHHKEQLRRKNEREGATFKISGDPRITRLGRFLRRYSLDELPQLFNVLKGEMSLVGPRPHPLDDCSRYQLTDLRRLDVVPGLTGLWQVTARGDPSFERNMALDLEYIERWNLWLDLKILCRTMWVVVRGTGA